MKIRILVGIASAALLVGGCSSMRQHMGASAENDQNVLTGGPIVGTTIADLPQAVKSTLQQRAPHAEISDIEKTSQNGQAAYRISFLNPSQNPTLVISQDGKVLSPSEMNESK